MDSGQISEGKNPRIMKIQLGGMEGFVMPGCSGQRPFFHSVYQDDKLGVNFLSGATVPVMGTVKHYEKHQLAEIKVNALFIIK